MKVFFLGGMYPNDLYSSIFEKSKGAVSFAANRYQWLLLKGLDYVCEESLDVISTPFIKTFPDYKDIYISKRDWKHTAKNCPDIIAPFINIRGVRQFSRYLSIRKELNDRINKAGGTACVILYSLDYAFLRAAADMKRQFPSVKTFAFVPDLPEIIAQYKTKLDFYRAMTKKYNLRKVNYFRISLDGYIIMAEPMRERLNINTNEFCLVDGICDPEEAKSMEECDSQSDGTKKIVYTGALNSNSGIDLLLDAFSKIEGDEYQLIIAGAGYFERLIKERSALDRRILYLGSVPKHDIDSIQQSATVLVNPRPSSGVDAAYSFPSKTIEYMLSGKPVVMFKLPGVSDEYYKHIYSFASENPTDMAKLLCDVCMNCNRKKGIDAREFVLKEKNYITQAKKIRRFVYDKTGYIL